MFAICFCASSSFHVGIYMEQIPNCSSCRCQIAFLTPSVFLCFIFPKPKLISWAIQIMFFVVGGPPSQNKVIPRWNQTTVIAPHCPSKSFFEPSARPDMQPNSHFFHFRIKLSCQSLPPEYALFLHLLCPLHLMMMLCRCPVCVGSCFFKSRQYMNHLQVSRIDFKHEAVFLRWSPSS